MAMAWELAAAALCEGAGEKPCGVCRQCRKVRGHIHPDVTLIERAVSPDTGKLYKDIRIDQIRALSQDASVLPNDAAGKVYIFPHAEEMNIAAQNAFLKLLEEPPAWVTFLLCAESRTGLLPTVLSRCAEKRAGRSAPQYDEDAERRADAYLDALHDRTALWRLCVSMEKLELAQLRPFVDCLRQKAPQRVHGGELLALEAFLDRAAEYIRASIGAKQIMGYLSTYLYNVK